MIDFDHQSGRIMTSKFPWENITYGILCWMFGLPAYFDSVSSSSSRVQNGGLDYSALIYYGTYDLLCKNIGVRTFGNKSQRHF